MKKLIPLWVLMMTAMVLTAGCSSKTNQSSGKEDTRKTVEYSGNPLFTADPSVIVHNDTLYLFTGSDEQAQGVEGFLMNKWYIFSTTDMVNWTNHGAILSVDDFEWGSHNAFAADIAENHGKFWWYVPIAHKDPATRTHEGDAEDGKRQKPV